MGGLIIYTLATLFSFFFWRRYHDKYLLALGFLGIVAFLLKAVDLLRSNEVISIPGELSTFIAYASNTGWAAVVLMAFWLAFAKPNK